MCDVSWLSHKVERFKITKSTQYSTLITVQQITVAVEYISGKAATRTINTLSTISTDATLWDVVPLCTHTQHGSYDECWNQQLHRQIQRDRIIDGGCVSVSVCVIAQCFCSSHHFSIDQLTDASLWLVISCCRQQPNRVCVCVQLASCCEKQGNYSARSRRCTYPDAVKRCLSSSDSVAHSAVISYHLFRYRLSCAVCTSW